MTEFDVPRSRLQPERPLPFLNSDNTRVGKPEAIQVKPICNDKSACGTWFAHCSWRTRRNRQETWILVNRSRDSRKLRTGRVTTRYKTFVSAQTTGRCATYSSRKRLTPRNSASALPASRQRESQSLSVSSQLPFCPCSGPFRRIKGWPIRVA